MSQLTQKTQSVSSESESSETNDKLKNFKLTQYCMLKSNKLKSKLFYVSVDQVDQLENNKEEVFNELTTICDSLMVADTSANDNVSYQHRLFVRLKKLAQVEKFCKKIKSIYNFQNVEDIFVETFGHSSIVKKVCAYDTNPLYKQLDSDEFSTVFKLHKWVTGNDEFSRVDTFFPTHKISVDYAQEYHRAYWESKFHLKPLRKLIQIKKFNSWQDEVVEWYNDWIDVSNSGPTSKKQLYIHGEANTGKSYFIMYYLLADYESQIFTPCPTDKIFCYSHWNERKYNILVADEFDLDQYNIGLWKRIISGQVVSISVKKQPARQVLFNIPMIFISTSEPDMENNLGLRSRLCVVNATGKIDLENPIDYNEYITFE
jgi:hypothetical protein